MNDEIILKFPNLLKQALEKKLVKLPADVKYEYDDKTAFRALNIVKGEPSQITAEAFASQIELKVLYPNNKNFKDYDESDINNYSCSLYADLKELKTAMHLPRQTKAVIKGLVRCENGAMNYNSKTTHINWWLYDNHSAVDDFEVMENVKT